jgi:hypothetical protein
MAIFKLGAIVTGIVGSIGGTTFKRGANNLIVTNKSFGGSRNKLLQNRQLNPIANLFKSWGFLSGVLQQTWIDEALNFQFPDKFGVQKFLTGRQLYTKMNIQLLPVGLYIDDASGMTSVVGELSISNALIYPGTQEASFDFFLAAGTVSYMVSAEITNNFLRAPSFTRREVIYYDDATGTGTTDFGAQFFAKFPQFDSTYVARIYVDTINDYGFKGAPIFINASTV